MTSPTKQSFGKELGENKFRFEVNNTDINIPWHIGNRKHKKRIRKAAVVPGWLVGWYW